MSLLQTWRDKAYDQNADKGALQRFWQQYFLIEKGIYEQLLTNPDEEVKGTVKELADKLGIRGTPTLFFSDGTRVPGAVEAQDINFKLKTLR